MRGRLITLEGVEGVGKSSIVPVVEEYLQEQGIEAVVTREPGGTALGEQLREVLLNTDQEIVPTAELLLMAAARAQHIEKVIEPALKRGCWVVCDRFIDSSYAYQGGGRELGTDRVLQLEKWLLGSLRVDLTLLLDVTRETSLARTGKRAALDRIEKEGDEFFDRVRHAFLNRSNRVARIQIIDANPEFEVVSKAVRAKLEEAISVWREVEPA